MRNPLQVEPEITVLQDWLCFFGACFLLLLPFTFIALLIVFALSWR